MIQDTFNVRKTKVLILFLSEFVFVKLADYYCLRQPKKGKSAVRHVTK